MIYVIAALWLLAFAVLCGAVLGFPHRGEIARWLAEHLLAYGDVVYTRKLRRSHWQKFFNERPIEKEN